MNHTDFLTKPMPRSKIEHMNFMGYEFMRIETKRLEVSIGENMMALRIAVVAVGNVR